MSKTPRKIIIRVALCGVLLSTGAVLAASQAVSNNQDVHRLLGGAGYTAVHDVEFKTGIWTAEATTAEGRQVDVLIDPATGDIMLFDTRNPSEVRQSLTRVHELLTEQGYSQVKDVEIDDGLWEIEAMNPKHQWVELVIHPVTGAVLSEKAGRRAADKAVRQNGFSAGDLKIDQIVAALQSAGYSDIHDLELDDGRWEAKAYNRAGQRVDLAIDPRTGAVLREKFDD